MFFSEAFKTTFTSFDSYSKCKHVSQVAAALRALSCVFLWTCFSAGSHLMHTAVGALLRACGGSGLLTAYLQSGRAADSSLIPHGPAYSSAQGPGPAQLCELKLTSQCSGLVQLKLLWLIAGIPHWSQWYKAGTAKSSQCRNCKLVSWKLYTALVQQRKNDGATNSKFGLYVCLTVSRKDVI